MFPDLSIGVSKTQPVQEPSITLKVSNADTIIADFLFIINKPTEDKHDDLCSYISKNIYNLLDYATVAGEKRSLDILINPDFLNVLSTMVTTNVIDLVNDTYRLKMNRIYYDYNKAKDHNVFIMSKLYEIACHINKPSIQVLMGFGLNIEQACYIVCARYSTATDIKINFKRVIRAIQTMPSHIMTEQTIVNIFSKICTSPVTDLFIAVMKDSFVDFYSQDEKYVYSTVSLAILDVVESMPMADIQKVLTSYAKAVPNFPTNPRFMLKSISVGDYPRINKMIDILEAQGIRIY